MAERRVLDWLGCASCEWHDGFDCHRHPTMVRTAAEHWCAEWSKRTDGRFSGAYEVTVQESRVWSAFVREELATTTTTEETDERNFPQVWETQQTAETRGSVYGEGALAAAAALADLDVVSVSRPDDYEVTVIPKETDDALSDDVDRGPRAAGPGGAGAQGAPGVGDAPRRAPRKRAGG
jgi:hypothetical protein